MRGFFSVLLGALAMIAVCLLSAFIAMRLAIHGREVEVPNVAGLTVAEGRHLAASIGLSLNIENRFYSTVTPAGRILSQYPAPGTRVRREWVVRAAESIGPQRVSVPDVIGRTEREATVTIRRLALDLGTVAYIAAPGPAGVVLSQTPMPAAAGIDGPRISLLVSEPVAANTPRGIAFDTENLSQPETQDRDPIPETAAPAGAAATSAPAPATAIAALAHTPASASSGIATDAYVMPNLIGLTLAAANSRVAAMGLHISSIDAEAAVIKPLAPIAPPAAPGSPVLQALPKPMAPLAPITLANTVVAQTPAAGRRVTKADPIRITLTR